MSYNQGGYGGGGYGGGGYGNSGYNNNAGGGYGSGGYGQQQQQQGGYNSNPYGSGGAGYGGGAAAGGNAGRYEPNRYGGAAQTGYGQQSSNPYGGNAYGQQQSNGYGQGGQGGYGGDSVEMTNVGAANGTGRTPQSAFGEARSIIDALKELETTKVVTIKELQTRSLSSSDPTQYREAIGKEEADLDLRLVNLKARLEKLTQKPGVSPDDRAEIKRAIAKMTAFSETQLKLNVDFENRQKATRERQYKIANPKASSAEVREAVEQMSADDGAIFSQALLNSDRKGQATSVLSNVRDRSAAITKITEDMVELGRLFEHMNTMVVEQQTQVDTIENQAHNVEQDVSEANNQLDGAVVKARAARKKKWICLGIVVAIILVIIIIIVIVVVLKNQASKTVSGSKRAITF